MPQLNSDEAANDEPTAYNIEGCEEEGRWGEDDHLNDIKGDLLNDIDKEPRNTSHSKSHNNGESSSKEQLERDPDEIKGPGRPSYIYPRDIGSIVSGLHPMFPNGGIPPNSKVPPSFHPYSVPYHTLLYGASPSQDIDSKTGMPRPHHPDIPSMYSLPGQLGQIPHPLAPWPTPPLYPICTASTIASTMASMLHYPHPFGPFASSAAAAAVASNMPRFPSGLGHPHGPGIHSTMIPHPGLVPNGALANMGNGQHAHHGKNDQEKQSRHSKSESSHGHSKRDRPYVKKPLNAFMLYMKEQRAKVVAECTLKESAAINQILGRKWHSLSREEQQKYYEMARKERQLHLQLYPGWSARDNYGKRKKRKKEKSQGECTAQNPKKCRAVFGLEQQQMWCAPCRRKKKCIRYQHDDDSDDDDLSPVQSPQYAYGNQQNPFDPMRSTSPLSITSQSATTTNGVGEYGNGNPTPRLPGNQISPRQSVDVCEIKQEMSSSPLGIEGQTAANIAKNFDPYTNRHPGRAPSSDNSFKSEGSPHSQGGDSNGSHGNGLAHRRPSNGNVNNNNSKDFNRLVTNGNQHHTPSNSVHRQTSAPSGGESRNAFRKSNSLDSSSDMPGTSGLGGRNGGPMSHLNSSGNSNASDSPGSRTHHRSNSINKLSNGPTTPHMHHPSPLHTPSTGLFLPPSPSYNHHNPHGGHPFISPYSPYFPPASMIAAALAAPPSPLGGLMLSSLKGIPPHSMGSTMGGPNPGSGGGHSSQSRVTPGVVEGKS